MKKRTVEPAWDAHDFCHWLVANGVSSRVAGNYASRCRRVEYNLNVCLCKETATEERFTDLMVGIQKYAYSSSKSKESAYALTGSLRLAARKFAQYWAGKKALEYPSSHGLSHYK